jgi:regulator of protease activity HflC (stomatin/prohibitin superfamily)
VDVEAHLEQLEALVAEARPVPLSNLVMVHRGDIEAAVSDLRAAVPEELREARWLLRERDDILATAVRQADQIRAEAEADAQRLRSDTEIIRTARREAERIVAEAKEDAHALQRDAEDYVEGRLAAFEGVLQKTLTVTGRGRERLREGLGPPDLDRDEADPNRPTIQLYDQERA